MSVRPELFSKKGACITQKEGRRCRRPGCNVILSIYNKGNECHSHRSEGMGDSGANHLGGGRRKVSPQINGNGHL